MIALLATVTMAMGCHSKQCVQRVDRKHCNQAHVKPCIRYAARRHHQPIGDALRVSWCESRWNPYAVGFGIHHGLFQFLSSTWQTTPYRHHSIVSARFNSLAAMWMWRHGRRGEWACV